MSADPCQTKKPLNVPPGPSRMAAPERPLGNTRGRSERFPKARHRRIPLSEADPLMHGHVPKIWDVVDRNIADLKSKYPGGLSKSIFGGNRSKTRKASNYVNRDCAMKDGEVVVLRFNGVRRSNQMRLIHEQLPCEWRNLQRDSVVSMNYTLADGFSKNLIVYPNRSSRVKFYSMDISISRPELDGIWADELIPSMGGNFGISSCYWNGAFLITLPLSLGGMTFNISMRGLKCWKKKKAIASLRRKWDQAGYKAATRHAMCRSNGTDNLFPHVGQSIRELSITCPTTQGKR